MINETALQFGLLLTAADGFSIVCKKRLIGGLQYHRKEVFEHPVKYDVPWLIGAIAFEYQRDQYAHGLNLSYARWI